MHRKYNSKNELIISIFTFCLLSTQIGCRQPVESDNMVETNKIEINKGSYEVADQFTPQNSGIPSGWIVGVGSTSDSTVWIGMPHAIAKLVGRSFTVLDTTNSDMPKDKYISAFYVDSKNVIWMAMTTSGIDSGGIVVTFDGATWKRFDRSNSPIPNRPIYTFYEDPHGNQWVGTEDGLLKYSNNVWTLYNKYNTSLTDSRIRAVVLDKEDKLWVGTYGLFGTGGLAVRNNSIWSLETENNSDLPCDAISSLALGVDSALWIGMYESKPVNQAGGLSRLKNGVFTNYNSSNCDMGGNSVRHVAFESSGRLFVGIDNVGLKLFDGNNWTSILTSYEITAIYISRNSNVWIGTYDQGLFKLIEGE
jgi:ligand-binding sensor domain-containing protein